MTGQVLDAPTLPRNQLLSLANAVVELGELESTDHLRRDQIMVWVGRDQDLEIRYIVLDDRRCIRTGAGHLAPDRFGGRPALQQLLLGADAHFPGIAALDHNDPAPCSES